jgi:glycosyltransferase involved in cell wall biosynthesis
MRVLYVSHTGHVSGGERSLLDLLDALGPEVSPAVAAPDGELSEEVRRHGLTVRRIPGTAGSLRPHPVDTPRAVKELAHAACRVRRISRTDRVDLVHANSIRAGIVAAIAARIGAPPAVVHVRDVLPDGPLTRLTRIVVDRGAAAVVGNSAHTLERFSGGSRDGLRAVAHSPVDLGRLNAAAKLSRRHAQASLGIRPGTGPVLGVVAQLTPWKAQDDAIRIVAGLREAHPGVHLLLVGSVKFASRSTRYDNRAFARSLETLVEELGLDGRVLFLGERQDVPELLRSLDMLLVPSWDEPFGRSAVEALGVGVPVAATSVGGPREILRDGVDGLLLPPRRPDAWVAALSPLLSDPGRLSEMSCRGRTRATAFDRTAHADRIVSIYERVFARDRPAMRNTSRRQPLERKQSGGFLARTDHRA